MARKYFVDAYLYEITIVMKLFFAADHGGYELKQTLLAYAKELGHDVKDCGALTYDEHDEYPDFVMPCARTVATTEGSMGVVIGGTGNGEAMAANRIPSARAALFYGPAMAVAPVDAEGTAGTQDGYDIVRLARRHNNANILSLGARFVTNETAKEALRIFLSTEFEGGRHEGRVAKLG